MRVVTTLTHNASGRANIVARFADKQKTTPYDHGLSHDRNHGIAAANVIIHVQHTSPALQYGDNIVSNAMRSLDAGYGTHTVSDGGGRHTFTI